MLMLRLLRPCLLLLYLLSAPGQAGNLTFSVVGLEGELERNALAWLGAPPDTAQDRLNFLASARGRVERGLQALGYYRPAIDLQVERTNPVWQLTITVQPGEPVHIRKISIQVLGPAADDGAFDRLIANAGFASGDVMHHGRYQNFRNRLLSLGKQRGYFDAVISFARVAVQADGGTADIFLDFQSGPRYRFGELVFDQALVDHELLDALLPFQQGDFFEQPLLQQFQAQIQRTHFFSSVIVRPRLDLATGLQVPVYVSLEATHRHGFDVGIGYSTDTQERLSLTWRTPRINRYGHSQVTRLEYSPVNPSGRFTYSIPLTHPLNDNLQLWLRTEDDEFGDLDSSQDEYGVRREIRRGSWVYGYSLRDLNESWEVLSVEADNRYLLLGASLSRRVHSGSIVDPDSGFNQLYTLEVGNQELGSDIDLVRFTANLRYVLTPAPRHRLVGRTELGAAEIASGNRSDLAPSLNFFAGGSESIRGFSYQSVGNEVDVLLPDGRRKRLVVGGDRLVTASLEYQYSFNDTWRGALFVDGGDAFDEGEFDLHYAAGFGIHYITPIGAVRVELANSLSEDNPDWRLHLAIGAEF